jgi:HK97 family phage portal protein
MPLFPRVPALNRLTISANWQPQSISDLDRQMTSRSRPTFSGVNVGENSALNYMALYACLLIRGWAFGSLSAHLYQRQDNGARRATEQRLYSLIHDAPNEEMSAVSWRAAKSGHIDTWGNGSSWIDRIQIGRNAGQIRQIYPLMPDRVRPFRDESGRLKYEYYTVKAGGAREPRTYDMSQVLHIPGLGYDGVVGYSPVSLQRQAIGLGLGAEEFEARFLGQGTHLSGAILSQAGMKDDVFDKWVENLNKQYAGLARTGGLLVLQGATDYKAMTMPLKDAEFLGLRQFQLGEMARLYRVPLVLLQDMEKASSWGTGVEQIMIGFVIFTIMPEAHGWEQRMNMRLLTAEERAAGYYFEHDLNVLMRGDHKSRGEFYQIMRNIGAMSPNEIRGKENMNPRTDPGGEKFWDVGPSGQQSVSAGSSSGQASLAAARPVLTDVATRILRRENHDILAQAEKWTKRDDFDGFTGWLGNYWDRHTLYCAETILPACTMLGRPETAVKGAKKHVELLQSALKAAQTGGIDAIRVCLESREPSDLALFEEEYSHAAS